MLRSIWPEIICNRHNNRQSLNGANRHLPNIRFLNWRENWDRWNKTLGSFHCSCYRFINLLFLIIMEEIWNGKQNCKMMRTSEAKETKSKRRFHQKNQYLQKFQHQPQHHNQHQHQHQHHNQHQNQHQLQHHLLHHLLHQFFPWAWIFQGFQEHNLLQTKLSLVSQECILCLPQN